MVYIVLEIEVILSIQLQHQIMPNKGNGGLTHT